MEEGENKEIADTPNQLSTMEGKEPKKTFVVPAPKFSMRTLRLPPLLQKNMLAFCKIFPSKIIKADAAKMFDLVRMRKRTLLENVNVNEASLRKYLYREELQEFSQKKESYKMINYGEQEAAAYLASVSPGVYAATKRVLNELKLREPHFKPTSMMDLGSGTGMTIWAANGIWPHCKFAIDCIEPSHAMVELSKTLLFDRENPQKESVFGDVQFSTYFKKDKMYDIVVASYTLSEFPHFHTRKEIARQLWQRTKKFLVVIDHGNWNGFRSVLAARHLATSKNYSWDLGSIVSPCPHVQRCPRTLYAENTAMFPCSFLQYAEPSYFWDSAKHRNFAKERFSFIILRKGSTGAEHHAHRLVDNPMRRSGHIIAHFCTPEARIEKHVFTKSTHKEVYKALRFSAFSGDELQIPKDYPPSVKMFQNYGKPALSYSDQDSSLQLIDDEDGDKSLVSLPTENNDKLLNNFNDINEMPPE